jgi:hypothetical protein
MSYSIADSDIAENVFGVHNTGVWTPTTLATLAAVFNTWNDTAVGGHSPYEARDEESSLLQTEARDLTTQSSPVVIVPYPGAHSAGGDVSGDVPNGLTKAFTARTGLSGRSQRGRTFVVALAQSSIDVTDANLVSLTTANDYVAWFNALIVDVSTANAAWDLCVISRFHNGAPRGAGVTTPITSYGYSNLYLDYQRRRAPGHGRHH